MKLQTLAAACAAVVTLSAGHAFAADSVTAKLQQPVAEKTKFIAGGAIFMCEADQCVAANATSQTFATATCKAVAAKVGPLAAFSGRKALEAERLADCNKTALARAATGARMAKQ
jgi:hypothetical protein